MINFINIDIERLPYTFDVNLSNRDYTFTIKYNFTYDSFTMDVKLGDKTLILGEKIAYGIPMFNQFQEDASSNQNPNWFTEVIYPYDLSDTETRVSIDNLNKTVFLYIFDKSELS